MRQGKVPWYIQVPWYLHHGKVGVPTMVPWYSGTGTCTMVAVPLLPWYLYHGIPVPLYHGTGTRTSPWYSITVPFTVVLYHGEVRVPVPWYSGTGTYTMVAVPEPLYHVTRSTMVLILVTVT
jgi:hypothetical protein